MTKTYSPKPPEITREWYVVDAAGQTLGRVATEVARLLRGKHKPMYATHVDTGDYVIIINAKDIVVTGNKLTDKVYVHHTMYTGGFREIAFRDQLVKHPTRPGQYNISVKVAGGGTTGQAGAIRHGIARALIQADETLRPLLKKNGLLTRDARAKERKKPGLKRARKAPQYTKR